MVVHTVPFEEHMTLSKWSVCTMVVHWVHLESKDALQMHPNALECGWVHLQRVCLLSKYTQCTIRVHTDLKYQSVCAMVVHWVHLESIDALQMHPNVLECIWVHFENVLCSPNVPNALP